MVNAKTLAKFEGVREGEGTLFCGKRSALDDVHIFLFSLCRDDEVVHGSVEEISDLVGTLQECENAKQARAVLDFFLI